MSLVELFNRNFAPELTTLSEGISYIDQIRNGTIQRHTNLSANYFAKSANNANGSGSNGASNGNGNGVSGGAGAANSSELGLRGSNFDDSESKANLDNLLGNAIAASDILIRGSTGPGGSTMGGNTAFTGLSAGLSSEFRDNRSVSSDGSTTKRSTLIMKQQQRGTSNRPIFN